jgi:hypothetical protein
MERFITKDYWRKFGLTPIDVFGVLVKMNYNSITVNWLIRRIFKDKMALLIVFTSCLYLQYIYEGK